MGININFYQFSKKVNSTARPTGNGATYNCVLKETCSILFPSIGLELGLATSPSSLNYAYIDTFNRYYYVREWTFENRLWYASLEVDVLASWKTEIGDSNCYILRSASDYNGTIVDTTYPTTLETTFQQSILLSPWTATSFENGTFIVGVAGTTTEYYVMDYSNFNMFFLRLFSNEYAQQLMDDWVDVFPQLKAEMNPMQYIKSVKWIPFKVDIGAGPPTSSIQVGWGVVNCNANIVRNIYSVNAQIININRHPQSIARGVYLNSAPYSSYTLFFPPWGLIELNPDFMANSESLFVKWELDFRTGMGLLQLSNTNFVLSPNNVVSWIHAQIAVDYQMTQIVNQGNGLGNVIPSLVSTATGIMTGNYGGAIMSAISAIGDAASRRIPSAKTIGSNGGVLSLQGIPGLLYEFKPLVDEDLEHRGRPLCENKIISTLLGYIMVSDADINLTSTKQESDSVRTYMEGGFFYE